MWNINALFLRGQMLRKHLHTVLRLELSDEPRVPKLACDTQVFTTPHERIGFARFCRCWNAGGVEVFLLTTGDGDETASTMSVR